MKLSTFALASATWQITASHTVFTTLFVDDVDQGDGTCVRMNMTPDNSTFPINDLDSNDMACGYDGTVGVARVCPVSQGSKLTFLWREWADASHPGSIDSSHKGPCAVYMKAVSSAIIDTGYGPGWFKVWDSGYDNTTSQWCTEKLIQNNGLLSVDIPNDIVGGYYLVRPELLALHQADKSPPNPQFYVGCAQVFLQSSGTSVPKETVSIPGYVHVGDPSVNFNIYTPKWPYPMPGPAPYEGGLSVKGDAKLAVTSHAVQEQGLIPNGCVLANANWCGMELESYNTEAGCWNASTVCFQQEKVCYSSSPPTGSKNCPIWEAKCDGIQAGCNAGNFSGPPDQGKDLNPTTTSSYSIPAVATEPLFTLAAASSSTVVQILTFKPETTGTDSLVTDTFGPTYTGSVVPSFAITDNLSESTSKTAIATTTIALSMILTSHSSLYSGTETAPTTTGTFAVSQNSTLPVSLDATCGAASRHTCAGSEFGSCCSQYNWCGITDAYCGEGCQVAYGTCHQVQSMKRSVHLNRHRAP